MKGKIDSKVLIVVALAAILFIYGGNITAPVIPPIITPTVSYCYQESATIANQNMTDGSCSLNYGGTYKYDFVGGNPSLTSDGNWKTCSKPDDNNGYVYVNYTKPVGYSSAIWQVYIESTVNPRYSTDNITISQDCWNFDSKKVVLRVHLDGSDGLVQCYTTSGWITLRSINYEGSSVKLCEEGIWWKS